MSRRLIIALTLVLPSVALAQRGGSRTQADRRTELFDKNAIPQGPAIRVRDIEDLSPLKLLVDKRKDLKLTDAQLGQIKEQESALKKANEPLMKALDSLIHALRPGNPTEDERARLRDARIGFQSTLTDVRAAYDSAAKDAVAKLEPEQQTRANEMLAKQREEGDKAIREKMSGGRDRPGAGTPD